MALLIYPDLPGLGYSVHWKPEFFNLPTQTMQTGARLDLGLSDSPIHHFELEYNFLRGQRFHNGSLEFRTMMGFFLALNGNLKRFLFRNVDDNYVSQQLTGIGDGMTTTFTLVRSFGVPPYIGTEAVGCVDLTRPFNVYLNDSSTPTDRSLYSISTINPISQTITFFTPPPDGQNIRVDMGYLYYCNFSDSYMDFEKFMNDLWMLKSVKFSSNRAGT